ncbi:unnamed protein product [Nippostrongylus brasiliensis]|uniref:Endo/exonuclease/phosphatase domain-containing protein n=1 Tax=Nippostrongylus brasiliensis TaxID=27835 RepID=A0A0N4YB87_NIPBR|nr:unnamed protein product [Nippostrongylus brasiliensis]
MKVIVVTEERRLYFFAAYAPQTGCSEEVKDEFWALLHEKTAEIPSEEMVVVAGDLNGHVGISKDGFKCHGGFGNGIRNEDGERILDYACSHNLAITNTMFRKHPSHLISFYSGNTRSQIDYVLVRRRDAKLVSDAKIVPYETVATQHRTLICTMKITPPKREWVERVEETWQSMKTSVCEAARSQLGVTKPGRRRIDKQTWLWTDEVKEKVRTKKSLYHTFLHSKTADNWSAYRDAKRAVKKAVTNAKAANYEEVNRLLESREGERHIYRLARSRQRQTEDVLRFYGVNDENGQLLMDRTKVMRRWRDYFEFPQKSSLIHRYPTLSLLLIPSSLSRSKT